jgi:hypothetical protein
LWLNLEQRLATSTVLLLTVNEVLSVWPTILYLRSVRRDLRGAPT